MTNGSIEDFSNNPHYNEDKHSSNLVEAESPKDLSEVGSGSGSKDPLTEQSVYSQYAYHGDAYTVCGKTVKKLPPGVYRTFIDGNGNTVFVAHPIKSDDWLNFHDSLINNVLQEIDTFWKRESAFKKYGYLQRRGYMFYGPPGTGKTVLAKQITHNIIQNGGIVIICDNNPNEIVAGLKKLNIIEPNRQIVCLFEDIDTIIERYGEAKLLSLLDGEDNVNHVLNIATTNYPEKLDRRLVGRPRRFDKIIRIGYPDEKMRRYYFEHKLKIEKDKDDDLDEWVKKTADFTFAAMSELVISVKCLGNSFESSIQKLSELLTKKVHSSDTSEGNRSVGFRV